MHVLNLKDWIACVRGYASLWSCCMRSYAYNRITFDSSAVGYRNDYSGISHFFIVHQKATETQCVDAEWTTNTNGSSSNKKITFSYHCQKHLIESHRGTKEKKSSTNKKTHQTRRYEATAWRLCPARVWTPFGLSASVVLNLLRCIRVNVNILLFLSTSHRFILSPWSLSLFHLSLCPKLFRSLTSKIHAI